MSRELFACVPLGVELTRRACGMQHLDVRAGHGVVGPRVAAACRGCEIGRQHSNDQRPSKWPDGSPMVTLGTKEPARTSTPFARPLPAREPPPPEEPKAHPSAKLYTHGGETLTIRQWAAKLNVSVKALRLRLRRWPLERALSEPRTVDRLPKAEREAAAPGKAFSWGRHKVVGPALPPPPPSLRSAIVELPPPIAETPVAEPVSAPSVPPVATISHITLVDVLRALGFGVMHVGVVARDHVLLAVHGDPVEILKSWGVRVRDLGAVPLGRALLLEEWPS